MPSGRRIGLPFTLTMRDTTAFLFTKALYFLPQSQDFVNDVLNSSVNTSPAPNIPGLTYRMSVQGRVPKLSKVQWHIARVPNHALTKRYFEHERVFNGVFSKNGTRFLASFQGEAKKDFFCEMNSLEVWLSLRKLSGRRVIRTGIQCSSKF